MQRKSSRHIHVCIKLCHNLQCLNQVSRCKESKQSPLDPSCGLNSDHTSGCISDIGNAERCWHSARKAFFQQYFRRSSSYSSIICITYMESQTTEQKLLHFLHCWTFLHCLHFRPRTPLRKNIQHNQENLFSLARNSELNLFQLRPAKYQVPKTHPILSFKL